MDPAASAPADRLISEQDLNSLGWTYAATAQTWNFHGETIPDLARKPAKIGEVLKLMRHRLGGVLQNIDNNIRALGVKLDATPGPTISPKPAPASPPEGGPHLGSPKELHEFLDAVVDAAKERGARVQIIIDPTKPEGGFDPLTFMEKMLGGRCRNCGGHHGS